MKLILQNLKRAGKTTIFNLIGLSVSFAAVIVLSIYIYNEYTFDHNHKNIDELYLLSMVIDAEGETQQNFWLPNPMADAIFENTSGFESQCSFAWGSNKYTLESSPDEVHSIFTRAVDSTFASMFTLDMKWGVDEPLKEKNRIIISEKTSERIFGKDNPVGKVLMVGAEKSYVIDGVYFDMPPNSSFPYEAFCSYPVNDWINEWSEYSFLHYFKIHDNADLKAIEAQIANIPAIENLINEYPDFKISFNFLPLSEYHFHPLGGQGNKIFVNTMIGVCILVLLMAFINYMNFGIAQAPKQAKSLSMRRVLGETKSRLTWLLSLESAFLMTFSFGIAMIISLLLFTVWPNILGYEIQLFDYKNVLIVTFSLFIVFGVLFSFIATHIILRSKPILALKGMISLSPKNNHAGRVLTVLQYSISILLIIGLLFLEKQIQHMKNFDLGFEKENIIVLQTTGEIKKQCDAFANELLKNPNIVNYAYSQFVPGEVGMGWGRNIEGKQVSFKCWPIDERYLSFMGFEIVDGRSFSQTIEADENSFIFNQKALSEFGWTSDYLGKNIPGFDFEGPLIGVVKDIKYASLHEEVQPMAFWLTKTRKERLSLKITNSNVASTIQHIETVYQQFEPKIPMEYSFLDDRLQNLYSQEEKQAELISIFSFVSILISSIGALGLIIFMCETKVKEIGIRKINGASILQVVNMLNMSMLKWILAAFVLAVPVSYFLIDVWLEGFAYRTSISWWIFAISGVFAFIVSLLVISGISYKAAVSNPIKSLRYE